MKKFVLMSRGRVILAVVTTAMWVAGCSSPAEQEVQPVAQTEPVSFRDGKISFATGDDFAAFIGKEFKKPYEAYQQDLRTIVPTSAQARMNADAEDDDVVKDPYFSGLLNADRELAIEGVNYRITSVGTFSFKEEKRAKIMEAIQKIQANGGKLPGSASGRQSSYQVQEDFIPIEGGDGGWYPVDNEVTTPPEDLEPIQVGPVTPYNGCGATTNSRTWTKNVPGHLGGFLADNILKGWNALRRGKDLKAVVWSENWGIYSSFGIKSVNQHKGWTGIWRRDDADYISWEITQSEVEFKDGLGNPVTFDVNGQDASQNASMVHELFDWNSAKFKIKVSSSGGTTYLYLPVPTAPASTYKVKKMRSCHFVRDEGNLTAQVKLEIN